MRWVGIFLKLFLPLKILLPLLRTVTVCWQEETTSCCASMISATLKQVSGKKKRNMVTCRLSWIWSGVKHASVLGFLVSCNYRYILKLCWSNPDNGVVSSWSFHSINCLIFVFSSTSGDFRSYLSHQKSLVVQQRQADPVCCRWQNHTVSEVASSGFTCVSASRKIFTFHACWLYAVTHEQTCTCTLSDKWWISHLSDSVHTFRKS